MLGVEERGWDLCNQSTSPWSGCFCCVLCFLMGLCLKENEVDDGDDMTIYFSQNTVLGVFLT